MEERYTPQPKLGKEVVLAEYAKTGLNMQYAEFFWQQYSATYDRVSEEMPEDEDNSDYALDTTKRGIPWYILYKNIGHPEKWCQMAWDFGAYEDGKTDSLKDMADCLWMIIRDRFIEHDTDFEQELRRHCDFIGERFGKSRIYMRFFYEWYEDLSGGSEMLDHFRDMEFRYNDAISKGKSEDFAYFYATWGRSEAWRIAELRERLKEEGRDEDYIRTYLYHYADALEEDGEERKHPDIPAYWEEKVNAYMKGWEYTQGSGKSFSPKEMEKFISIYVDVYLQASHPNNPNAIPWDRFDEFVLDISERRFRGDNVEIEPWDPELIQELMRMNQKHAERKSRSQQIIEDTLDMMFPNGSDDDD